MLIDGKREVFAVGCPNMFVGGWVVTFNPANNGAFSGFYYAVLFFFYRSWFYLLVCYFGLLDELSASRWDFCYYAVPSPTSFL